MQPCPCWGWKEANSLPNQDHADLIIRGKQLTFLGYLRAVLFQNIYFYLPPAVYFWLSLVLSSIIYIWPSLAVSESHP
jgi:hypothetical protein